MTEDEEERRAGTVARPRSVKATRSEGPLRSCRTIPTT